MRLWLKNHLVLWILIFEVFGLLVWGAYIVTQPRIHLVLDEELAHQATQGSFLLPEGIYDVEVQYEKEYESDGGWIRAYGNTKDERGLWCDTVSFASGKESMTFSMWINEKEVDGMRFAIDDEQGNLTVRQIIVTTAWNSKLYLVVCAILKVVFVDILAFGYHYRECFKKYSAVLAGIAGITVLCSLGLMTRYLIMGHDAMFHMNRIEGLKDGLLSGNIPVRVQPGWNYGWGYGVSLMYGDLLLLFPALMRICGFTITTAWKAFHIAINFATAAASFYAFYQISRKKYLSLLVTLLYCTSYYRLACIYVRSAVGETAVMIFLPLVLLFFWYALGEDTEHADYGTRLVVPVVGFTGMIQTHILTCEMLLIFMLIFCVLMYRRLFRKKTILYLVKVAVLTVLVNLWFLIPFLQMFQEDLVVTQLEEMRDDFQIWGLSITELFATRPSRAYYFTFEQNTSLANKCTLAIGTALWGAACTSGMILWNQKLQRSKAAACSLFMGVLAAFMATNLFPYAFLKEHVPVLSTLLSKVQFSYRFLGMASLFFAIAFFFSVLEAKREDPGWKYVWVVCMLIGAFAVYQGMDYQYEVLYGGTFSENKYSGASLNTAEVISGEYLYQGSDVELAKTQQQVEAYQMQVQDVERQGLYWVLSGKASDEGAYVEIPQFYYPGYMAKDEEGREYRVTRSGNNNRIHVELPDDFEGSLEIFYQEPWLYRVCEGISILAVLGLCIHQCLRKYKERI